MEFLHNGKRTSIDVDVLVSNYSKDEAKKIFKDNLSEDQLKELLKKFPRGENKEGGK